MKQNTVITIVIVLIVGAGAFFGGMKYQERKRPSFPMGQFGQGRGQNASGMNGTNRSGFRPVSGEILKSDATSITVKLPDGSSKIVLIADTTKINKATEGTASDLTVGQQVMVIGSENTDGSVSAQNVQINPIVQENPQRRP